MWQAFFPRDPHSIGMGKDRQLRSCTDRDGTGSDKKLKPATLVKVRHIMCKKQSKILEALCIIKEGNKFEQVAREFSEDKASVGGELGWKRQRDLVGPFADAAFKLDVGEMTQEPVRTQSGFHLILCEGRKASL